MRLCARHLVVALGLLIAAPALTLAGEAHGVALLVTGPTDGIGAESAPVTDVRPVAAALAARGFATTIREGLRGDDLGYTVEQFVRTAPTNGVAFVYLAGGVTVRSIRFDRVLDLIRKESGAAFTILVLDGSVPPPQDGGASPVRPGDKLVLCHPTEGFAPSFVSHLMDPKMDPATAVRAAAEATDGWASALPETPFPPIRPGCGPATAIAEGAKAGDEWVNPFGTVFCWCPPGTPASEGEGGFWLGKYEITRREFNLVTMKKPRGALAVLPAHPRDGIHYRDILQYVFELNRRERFFKRLPDDWEYALPTESEWEYACRAGTRGAFYFGEAADRLPDHANFADRSLFETGEEHHLYADQSLLDGTALLAEVGRYRANPWGLHDLYGNLWEWTATIEEEKGRSYPVARGGSWASLPGYCRSDFRHRFETATERNFIGFRLALRRTEPLKER